MDWAVVTIQAGQLLLRFTRDRGDFDVRIASSAQEDRWVDVRVVCLLILLEGKGESPDSSVRRIKLPPIPDVLRDHFERFEAALSPYRFNETEVALRRISAMRSAGTLDVFNVRPDPGFLANYGTVSDEIGRVPFWKPLGINVLLVLLAPFALLVLILLMPILLVLRFRKKPNRGSLPVAKRPVPAAKLPTNDSLDHPKSD